MNTKKTKKVSLLAVVSEIFQILLILFLVIFNIATFGVKIPFLSQQGFNFFAVTSGSMTPIIPVGALIRVSAINPAELTKGDIITFNHSSDETESVYVTHRIDEIKKIEEVKQMRTEDSEEEIEKKLTTYEFVTKGDANNAVDASVVLWRKVVGKYEWHLPYLGYLTAYAQTDLGFVLLVIIPAVILIVWEVISLALHLTSVSKARSNQEIKKLKKQLTEEKQKNKEI